MARPVNRSVQPASRVSYLMKTAPPPFPAGPLREGERGSGGQGENLGRSFSLAETPFFASFGIEI